MKISKAHQRFAERLQKPDALKNPQNYLGPNYLAVINFWLWIDTLSTEQWKEVSRRYYAIPDAAWNAARDAARDAAGDVARVAALNSAWNAAWDAACDAADDAAWVAARVATQNAAAGSAAAYATYELIGSHILIKNGTPLTFLPLFNDL